MGERAFMEDKWHFGKINGLPGEWMEDRIALSLESVGMQCLLLEFQSPRRLIRVVLMERIY